MIDHKKNRENIIRDLKLNLIGPSPCGAPLKTNEKRVFESYQEMYLPYRQFDTAQPNNEGDEILNNQKPSERYGLGVLYPVKPINNIEDNENENLDINEIENSSIQTKSKFNIYKNKNVNDNIENLKNDLNIQVEKDLLPSSFSLSFLIDVSKSNKLNFEFTGGYYDPIDMTNFVYNNKQGEEKKGRDWFKRIPYKHSGIIDLSKIKNGSVTPDESYSSLLETERLNIQFKAEVRDVDNNKIITFSVANYTGINEKRRNLDENSIFQSYLKIFSDNYCILPYPKTKSFQLDEEEQINDLLYRDKRNYAIGHGISANWGEPNKITNCVKEINSEAMPIVDVPNISPDVFDEKNKKVEIPFFNLTRSGNFDEGIKDLENLYNNYSIWIKNIEIDSKNLSNRHNNASKIIVKNCYGSLERIRSGIELLKTNNEAKLAFQIANEAIMYQQYRTSLKPRHIDFDENGNPLKEGGSYKFSNPFDNNFDLKTPEYQIRKWRPFQIAFVLMNLKSLANPNSSERQIVDMLWFPTGGGKTEAYLGLAAFGMSLRRIKDKTDFGTDVIMRYTLRLLTAQQFHRASGLICALEHIRKSNLQILGDYEFSIGIWIGGDSTYNSSKQAHDDFKKIERPKKGLEIGLNKFHITSCPWCAANFSIKSYEVGRKRVYGLKENFKEKKVYAHCPDNNCEFKIKLPIYTCDQDLYEHKPTFIIATIDKFALLAWRPEARSFFGIDDNGNQIKSPPNLIIQDELHLISGPLGSMSGMYESVVEDLCTNKKNNQFIKPKIISSTATIKNFNNQIKALFGRTESQLFPPPGINFSENFFSRFASSNEKIDCKKYVGIYAPGLRSLLTSQIRTFTSLFQSANYDRIGKKELSDEEKDPWWTLLSFYSSLFDLGSARSILSIDMEGELKKYKDTFGIEDKHLRPLPDSNEVLELTAAQKDSVEENLQRLSLSINKLTDPKSKAVDICLSSSVIEVGVDITRVSLLSIVSAPKSVSQYIQVSGRVGRDWQNGKSALVVTIYSPTKPRDRSLYEQFRSFHEQLYSWVEPTSVTPFCEPVLERSLHAALFAFVRQTSTMDNAKNNPSFINYESKCEEFKNIFLERVKLIDEKSFTTAEKYFNKKLNYWKKGNFDNWESKKKDNETPLLVPQGNYLNEKLKFKTFQTMTSMRNVDAECMPEISGHYYDTGEESEAN